MRIALFGGSFDPPHLGHVLAATYARVMAEVDQVWVLPVSRHAYAKPLSPWDQRWELCLAAFASLPFVSLHDDELRNPDGYTIDLVETLQGRLPGHEWFLIGGSDTIADLPQWHRGRELLNKIGVIAVPRRGLGDDLPTGLPAIASSVVRVHIQNGADPYDMVPPGVARLIRFHKWYIPGTPVGNP